MCRVFGFVVVAFGIAVLSGNSTASEVSGIYIEARTCQVYTGPCFANGEVGLAGKNAVMSWSIEQGSHAGVDLSGLSVTVVLQASDTLGFRGFDDATKVESVVFVDENASAQQRLALTDFVKRHTSARNKIVDVRTAPIKMELDKIELKGKLSVGNVVRIEARKARPSDCICANESAYYPPLTDLAGFVPGVTIVGEVSARRLGSRWSIPDSRTAYLGTFSY